MKHEQFDHKKFGAFIRPLLTDRGLTMRRACLQAGMNQSTLAHYLRGIRAPTRDSLLLLAETLDIDANEMLAAAGYEPLPALNRAMLDTSELPPDLRVLALELARVEPVRRNEIVRAIRSLLKAELPD